MKTCIRCGEEIKGKSERFCSTRCNKLYLKSGWRKRHHERILQYNRDYKSKKRYGKALASKMLEKGKRTPECIRCGNTENIHGHHVRPLSRGGKDIPENIITLCSECHIEWHKVIPNFYWDRYDISAGDK
jgi:5-methylcytosine-specific restriction endonuclease McrA